MVTVTAVCKSGPPLPSNAKPYADIFLAPWSCETAGELDDARKNQLDGTGRLAFGAPNSAART